MLYISQPSLPSFAAQLQVLNHDHRFLIILRYAHLLLILGALPVHLCIKSDHATH